MTPLEVYMEDLGLDEARAKAQLERMTPGQLRHAIDGAAARLRVEVSWPTWPDPGVVMHNSLDVYDDEVVSITAHLHAAKGDDRETVVERQRSAARPSSDSESPFEGEEDKRECAARMRSRALPRD